MDAQFWMHRLDRTHTAIGHVAIAKGVCIPGLNPDEVAVTDRWARYYMRKVYKVKANLPDEPILIYKNPLEIFTTGIESLMSKSRYFSREDGVGDEFNGVFDVVSIPELERE